jgi:hypothetical protein
MALTENAGDTVSTLLFSGRCVMDTVAIINVSDGRRGVPDVSVVGKSVI